MTRSGRRDVLRVCSLLLALVVVAAVASRADAQGGRSEAPAGQMTWAVHFSLAPTFFDPAETPGIITPFLVLYALPDDLVKPMPGKPRPGTRAESGRVS